MRIIINGARIAGPTLAYWLRRAGHEVLLATTGAAGIEIFRREAARIGIVLLDVGMPGMPGDAVLAKIRALSPDVPVIIISGYSQQDVSAKFRGLNVTQFIQKPFSARKLDSAVAEVLSQMSRLVGAERASRA